MVSEMFWAVVEVETAIEVVALHLEQDDELPTMQRRSNGDDNALMVCV